MRRIGSITLLISCAACGAAQQPPSHTSCAEPEAEEPSPRRVTTLADLRASGPLARLSWLSGEWHSWDEESRRLSLIHISEPTRPTT